VVNWFTASIRLGNLMSVPWKKVSPRGRFRCNSTPKCRSSPYESSTIFAST